MTTAPGAPDGSPEGTLDPLVGKLLADRYRILAKLGEGAMGAVYVGEHLRIGRRDAIKVLRPGLAGDAEAIARFTRGTRNVSAIHHPNVCTIYDFSDTPEGVRYLAMEFVEGETLKDVLDREGRLPVSRAVEITRQVADALQAAHEAGVIHRDLKPGNIMICRRPDGRDAVKVVDFDIAKGPDEPEGEEVTRMGFVVGTPEYMSPEQLIGDRLDGRSDLYSLGVVLFRMLAGALPFRAGSTQEIMVQRLTGEPLRLEDAAPGLAVPPPLQAALQRSLARKPQDRQASAGQFGREVVASLAAAPAGALPPVELAATRIAPAVASPAAASPVTRPDRQRRPWVVAGATAATVVLLAAAGTLFLKNRAEPAPAASDGLAPAPVITASEAPVGTDADLGVPAGDTTASTVPPVTQSTPRDQTSTPPPRDRGPVVPGGVRAMLERQMLAVPGSSGSELRAARDSAELGWRLAASRGDSAVAALVLAHAAFTYGDNAECFRWARRAAALGAAGTSVLIQECQ